MSRKASKPNGEFVATTYNFPEFARGPAPKKTILQCFYDSKTGEVLSRTPTSWAKILSFYACFYIVLSALFAICMQVLFTTLTMDEPKWKLDESLIGTNPGLGFRPISNETEHGSLIWFKENDTLHAEIWTNFTESFLKQYRNKTDENGRIRKKCTFKHPPKKGEACLVDVDNFGDCVKKNHYGYFSGKPCIFLKLNKIYNWVPEYYDNVSDLPKEMPPTLKTYIGEVPEDQRKQVWVSCKGEYASDRESIGKKEVIYIQRGFPSYYYPYTNAVGYLNPLVAVQFIPRKNRIVNIECRAWAKNILYSGSYRDRQGSIHFELMVDGDFEDEKTINTYVEDVEENEVKKT